MAYVAITQTLISEVQGGLNTMREAELKTLPSAEEHIAEIQNDAAFRKFILDKIWAPVEDLRERLQPYNQENLFVRFDVMAGDPPVVMCLLTLMVEGGPCILKGTGTSHYYPHRIEAMGADDHPLLPPLIAKLKDIKDAKDRWETVTTQVTEFLNSCKSLNEAVKLWPDVRRYIPKKYLERLDAKSERAVKEESKAMAALRAIDMDVVNTSTVLARMAGAKV